MKKSPEAQRLQETLKRILEESEPDYGKLLAISAQLAAFDLKNVRFTADSGLISRLGKELVARQETAVSELIKNAYDADARTVRATFFRARQPGGTLIVEDDGVGMTRLQLINGFMRLASTEKIREPLSPRFRRQRAGRKGIGRFAAQRLGKQLALVTQTARSQLALELSIDWRDFDQEANLLLVPNRIREIPKKRKEGTTLRITGLREAWTDAEIARVYRYVSDLIQPFPLSRVAGDKKRQDPGFKATFYRRGRGKTIEVASEDKLVFDYALAVATGKVDADGRGEWNVVCKRYDLDDTKRVSNDKENPRARFKHLQDVFFKAYYFIWTADLVPGQQLTRLRSLAAQQGGIRLYRNGFRVLPYGEPQDDWLGLNEEYRKRTILPPIANNNWFGFVQVTDPEGVQFEETSSREGLAHSHSYRELTQFLFASLVGAAQTVNSVRDVKLKAGERDFISKRLRAPIELFERTAIELDQAATTLERDGVGSQSINQVRGAADGIRKAGQVLVEENAMLRVLSSLGLTIGIFTHEIRHQLFNLKNQIRELLEVRGREKDRVRALRDLDSRVETLRSYTAYFDSAVSENVRRELKPIDLSEALFDFVSQFRQVADRAGTKFVDEDIAEGLMTAPMHPSELASILGNLLTNSLKAIRRGPNRGRGKLSISARQENKHLIIDFLDNGEGVLPKNRERIFDPFFTTTASTSQSRDELTGTGLGLKIVRDIVSSYRGEIYVTNAPRGYVTCMRIELPAA